MNKFNNLMIGISANAAQSGKDTLCRLLIQKFSENNIIGVRIGLADKLKNHLTDFCLKYLGINPHYCNAEEKEIVRTLLVCYGKIQRKRWKGTYWTNLVQDDVDYFKSINNIPIITDCRYVDEYENDECVWLFKNNGVLVFIERIGLDGKIIEPPNEEEKKNAPLLKEKANYIITWPTGNDESLKKYIDEFYSWLIKNNFLKSQE